MAEMNGTADVWRDMGIVLVWGIALLAPLPFRRGIATAVTLLLVMSAGTLSARPAEAGVRDWMWRRDQLGAEAFDAGRHDSASELFEDPSWRAASLYRDGRFEEAAAIFAERETQDDQYNLGNALARAGQLEEALAAYDRVLAEDPDHDDALHNRELVAKLLEQQQQQEQQQQDQQQDQEEQQGQQNEQDPQQGSQGQQGEQDGQDEQGGQQQAQSQQSEPSGADATGSDSGGDAQQDDAGDEPDDGAQAGASASADDREAAASAPDYASDDSTGSAGTASTPRESSEPEPGEPRPGEQQSAGAAEAEARAEARARAESDPADAGTTEQAIAPGEPGGEEAPPRAPASAMASQPLSERDQAVEQWLSRVSDDPGGLLREKLRRRYTEKRYETTGGQIR
jgi:Ca-activated chloride channel family protein